MDRRVLWIAALCGGAALVIVGLAGCNEARTSAEKGDIIFADLEYSLDDDRLEDKHPQFAPELTQLAMLPDGTTVWLNGSQAIIGLDMVGMIEDDAKLEGRIFPNFSAALKAQTSSPPLFSLDQADSFTKYTDDRLYAGLELVNDHEDAVYPGGKQAYLRVLLAAVEAQPAEAARDEACAFLAAALKLGGDPATVEPAVQAVVDQELQSFEAQPQYSKPVGFYTESEELKRIFRRDRLLQQPFGSTPYAGGCYAKRELAAIIVIARAVKASPALLDAYTKYLRLMEVMTNPVSNMNLLDLLPYESLWDDPAALWEALEQSPAMERCTKRGNIDPASVGVAFWPFSTAKENRLFARLYSMWETLPPTSTMDDFIKAIRAGEVSLAPEADSGWYDYQLYALEPLLLPERALETDKLLLHVKYKGRLANVFKSLATQRRETHIKQLQTGAGLTCAPVPVEMPDKLQLSLEPAATNYLRTARGYTFLADALAKIYGPEQYAQLVLADQRNLAEALDHSRRTFYGFYLLACDDMKLPLALEPADLAALAVADPDVLPAVDEDVLNQHPILRTGGLTPAQQQAALYALNEAKTFIEGYAQQPCAQYDARVIVPVLSDMERKEWRYWVVVGVQYQRVRCWFAQEPLAVAQQAGANGVKLSFAEANTHFTSGEAYEYSLAQNEYLIPSYVFTEITLGAEPPTREELRAICDKCDTLEEITKALKQKFQR